AKLVGLHPPKRTRAGGGVKRGGKTERWNDGTGGEGSTELLAWVPSFPLSPFPFPPFCRSTLPSFRLSVFPPYFHPMATALTLHGLTYDPELACRHLAE